MFSTLDRPWQTHPAIGHWKIKPLAERTEGAGPAALVNIPVDEDAPEEIVIVGSEDPHWLYIISGDLNVRITTDGNTNDIELREGSFLRWDNTASVGYSAGVISNDGAVVLCVSHNLANTIKE